MLKEFIPPILIKLYKRATRKYGWYGDYSSWEEAQKDSTGYDSEIIVEKVKTALLKVKNGEAIYERDSVLFNKIEYSWPVLTGLLWIAAQYESRLNVLDFGGSLGSTYFQNRNFLSGLKEVKWSVVEQELFVDCGKKHFEDSILKFYTELETCFTQVKPNVVLFSCVLQYLESPYQILKSTLDFSPEFIIIDSMPFLEKGKRITIQKVFPETYLASYPCWLLNRNEFLDFFNPQYEMVSDFISDLSIPVDLKTINYEGFIFRKKNGNKNGR